MTTPIDWTAPPVPPVEGAMMKTRDGRVVGPMTRRPRISSHRWGSTDYRFGNWTDDGCWLGKHQPHARDLIAVVDDAEEDAYPQPNEKLKRLYAEGKAMRSPAPADARAQLDARLATARNEGIEAACLWVEARRDEYVRDHGIYDPSTGITEFPGNGDETVAEWEEIAEGIRALKTKD